MTVRIDALFITTRFQDTPKQHRGTCRSGIDKDACKVDADCPAGAPARSQVGTNTGAWSAGWASRAKGFRSEGRDFQLFMLEPQPQFADRLQKFLKRNGTLPHEKGLAAEVAEAIVDALRRQERRNARPEIFVCAQYLWAEMVRRHDLY